MSAVGLLEGFTASVGEELNELAGLRTTRLTAQLRPETQVQTGVNTLGSVDGIVLVLASGTFDPAVVAGMRLRALSGAYAGLSAMVLSVDSTIQVTLATGLGGAFALVSWEVVEDAEDVAVVETTLDWPASGRVYIDATPFSYAGKTLTTLTGLRHFDGVQFVAGADRLYEPLTDVLEFSRTWSALEKLRLSFYVDHAEGADLSIVGDNVGVPRAPYLVDDEAYRRLIKAIAYVSKGTTLALELALDALLGETLIDSDTLTATKVGAVVTLASGTFDAAVTRGMRFRVKSGEYEDQFTLILSRDSGTQITLQSATAIPDFALVDWEIADPNWEVFEDLTFGSINNPARVFLRRRNQPPTTLGKAFLESVDRRPLLTSTTLALDPAQTFNAVRSVQLSPELGERRVAEGSNNAASTNGVLVQGSGGAFPARIRVGDTFQILSGDLAGASGVVTAFSFGLQQITLGKLQGARFHGVGAAFNHVTWRVYRSETNCRVIRPSDDTVIEYDGDAGTQAWTVQGTLAGTETTHAYFSTSAAEGDRLTIDDSNAGAVAADTIYYRRLARVIAESEARLRVLFSLASFSQPDTSDNPRQFTISIEDGERLLAVGGAWDGVSANRQIGFINAAGAFIGTPVTVTVSPGVPETFWKTCEVWKRGRGAVTLLLDGRAIQTLAFASFSASALFQLSVGNRATNVATVSSVKSIAWFAETPTEFWNRRLSGTGSTTGTNALTDSSAPFVAGDAGRTIRVASYGLVGATFANGEWLVDSFLSTSTVALVGPTRPSAKFSAAYPTRIVVRGEPEAFTYPYDVGHKIEILDGANGGPTQYTIARVLDPITLRDVSRLYNNLGVDIGPKLMRREERSNVIEVVGATFVTQDEESSYKLIPVFPIQAGLSFEIVDRGSVVGPALALPAAVTLPLASAPVMDVSYSTLDGAFVEDALAVNAETSPGVYALYPFYLSDPFAWIRDIIEALLAGGVIPDFDSLATDEAGRHLVS